MPAFAFDTLEAKRTLTDAGLQEPVAEAIVNAMNDAVTEGVATKADVAKLESDIAKLEVKLESDIAKLEVKLESDIAKLELKIESGIASLRAELKADVARLESGIASLESRVMTEISSTKWALGFLAAMQILMAGRMFGAF